MTSIKAIALFMLMCLGTAFSQTYPVTDNFSTAGALSSNWTQATPTPSGFVPVVSNGSAAVSSSGSGKGLAIYTGAGFNYFGATDEKVDALGYGDWTNSSGYGVCVRMSAAGTGMCYIPILKQIFIVTAGSIGAALPGGYCNNAVGTDVPIEISVAGQTYTCTAGGQSVSFTDTNNTFTSGQPAILIDQSVSPNYVIKGFSANCANADCGRVPTPVAMPAPGTYGNVPSGVAISSVSGATICYRTDGTAPAATTPGTCDAGSTTYTAPVAANYPGVTVKAIATMAGAANSAVANLVYNIPGLIVRFLCKKT